MTSETTIKNANSLKMKSKLRYPLTWKSIASRIRMENNTISAAEFMKPSGKKIVKKESSKIISPRATLKTRTLLS